MIYFLYFISMLKVLIVHPLSGTELKKWLEFNRTVLIGMKQHWESII